jgi:hypothetical protein
MTLIPAPPGFYVSFTGDGVAPFHTALVAAFDEDGRPLITDERGLVSPDEDGEWWLDEHQTVGPLTPADGWFARYESEEWGVEHIALIAWTRNRRGNVIGVDDRGDVLENEPVRYESAASVKAYRAAALRG